MKVDSELSDKCEVTVGMHQVSVLSLFLFSVVVDVVTELMDADDIVRQSRY